MLSHSVATPHTGATCSLILLLAVAAVPAAADPTLECSAASSQVETAECLAAVETTVDATIETALGFAMDSAKELDEVTGREVMVSALTAAQAAWTAYRDAECEAVGASFGGGSGTGIAIRACRIDLGRERVARLMQSLN